MKAGVRVAVVGVGAFGRQHLEALRAVPQAAVVAVAGADPEQTRRAAEKFDVPCAAAGLDEVLAAVEVDAVVLATPTPLHAEQAVATMRAGKHVLVEIPIADSSADARLVDEVARETGLVCMAGHTRRFNPSHQWVHAQIRSGELSIQQMDVQTYFMRRSNLNAVGEPRTWTDHLLWHHAAHTVDLFAHQTGEPIVRARALQGPPHPELGIAMDMSVQLQAAGGALCTLSLSFNNDGPFGTVFRYIGDTGTYVARYDQLFTGSDDEIDVSGVAVSSSGVELEDREFVAAVREGRQPSAAVSAVLPAYEVLAELERDLTGA